MGVGDGGCNDDDDDDDGSILSADLQQEFAQYTQDGEGAMGLSFNRAVRPQQQQPTYSTDTGLSEAVRSLSLGIQGLRSTREGTLERTGSAGGLSFSVVSSAPAPAASSSSGRCDDSDGGSGSDSGSDSGSEDAHSSSASA